jgi:hypothetical protein
MYLIYREESFMESWFMAGSHPKDYEQGIDTNTTYNGKKSGYLKSAVEEPEGFGTMPSRMLCKADS